MKKNGFLPLILFLISFVSAYSQTASMIARGQAINFTTFKDKVYFCASNGGVDVFLYESDGTKSGTFPVLRTVAQVPNSYDTPYPIIGNKFFFIDANNGLWSSDGTKSGTTLVKQFGTSSNSYRVGINRLYPTSKKIYLYVSTTDYINSANTKESIWVTDGTTEGTKELVSQQVILTQTTNVLADLVVVNDLLFFMAGNSGTKTQLWVADGTNNSARKLYEFTNLPCFSGVYNIVKFKNQYIFRVGCNGDIQMWMTDLTSANTRKITNCGAILRVVNDKIIYTQANDEVWTNDGTPTGSKALTTAAGQKIYARQFNNLDMWQNAVYIVDGRRNLWKTDGTSIGTIKITDSLMSVAPHSSDTSFIYWDSKTDFFKIDKLGKATSIFKHNFYNGDDSDLQSLTFEGKNIYFWDFQSLKVYNSKKNQVEFISNYSNNFSQSYRAIFPTSKERVFIHGSETDIPGQYTDRLKLYDLATKTKTPINFDNATRQSLLNSRTFLSNNKLFFTGQYINNPLQPYLTYAINLDVDSTKIRSTEEAHVFPNPNTGQFRVCSKELNILSVEVLDILGRTILVKESSVNEKCRELNLTQKGVFFVKVNFGNTYYTQKVFVR